MKHMEMNRNGAPSAARNNPSVNISKAERWASVIGGTALAIDGMRHTETRRGVEVLLGAALLYRGTSGHSNVYQALNINTAADKGAAASLDKLRTIKIKQIYTINRAPQELYDFWSRFENLPRIMRHLESVHQLDNKNFHFKSRGLAGSTVEWGAQITEQVANETIAWRSLEGSDIANTGSVRFRPAPAGRGTEVEVHMEYAPVGGAMTNQIAKLFGKDPERELREGLRHFKQLMEAGEIPTTEGQPKGPR